MWSACVCLLRFIAHPIIDRTMDFRTLWRIVICPPLAILLFYWTPFLLVVYLVLSCLHARDYVCTFALLYLIAGPPEPNPSPRSTAVWKFVVVWALLVYLKFCEVCIVVEHGIFKLYWFVFDQLFNYDVVFLRKMGQRGQCMFEKCMDDLVELFTLFSFPPRLGTRLKRGWELVGACRSSNCGFDVYQFYQVTIFDVNIPIDDPFRPDHSSTLHMVELRRRNSVWYTIVIWRMSLINNGQWKVHEFDFNCDTKEEQELVDLFASGSNRMASFSFLWSTTFASTALDWTWRWITTFPSSV